MPDEEEVKVPANVEPSSQLLTDSILEEIRQEGQIPKKKVLGYPYDLMTHLEKVVNKED